MALKRLVAGACISAFVWLGCSQDSVTPVQSDRDGLVLSRTQIDTSVFAHPGSLYQIRTRIAPRFMDSSTVYVWKTERTQSFSTAWHFSVCDIAYCFSPRDTTGEFRFMQDTLNHFYLDWANTDTLLQAMERGVCECSVIMYPKEGGDTVRLALRLTIAPVPVQTDRLNQSCDTTIEALPGARALMVSNLTPRVCGSQTVYGWRVTHLRRVSPSWTFSIDGATAGTTSGQLTFPTDEPRAFGVEWINSDTLAASMVLGACSLNVGFCPIGGTDTLVYKTTMNIDRW